MAASIEETLTSVWRQVLVEDAKSIRLENRSFPDRHENAELLTTPQLLGRLGADASCGFSRLLLSRKPIAHVRDVIDVIEDKAADFRSGWTKTPGNEALQCPYGAI
jgi:hypothetical protein